MTKPRAKLRQAPANAILTEDPMVSELFFLARERGLSDRSLEALLGYSRIAIYYARRGNRNPKLPFVRDFATLLGFELVLIPKRKSQNGELFASAADLPRPDNHRRLAYSPLRWSKNQPDD